MKKSAFFEWIAKAETKIQEMRLTNETMQYGQVLSDQEYLFRALRHFMGSEVFSKLKMGDEVSFLNFIKTMGGFFDMSSGPMGFLEFECLDWLRASHSHPSFFGNRGRLSRIRCLNDVIFLDGEYQDARAMLHRMQERQRTYANVFEKPNGGIFSPEAQAVLRRNPTTAKFFASTTNPASVGPSQRRIPPLLLRPGSAQSSFAGQRTFMGTSVEQDVLPENRVWLDGRYEDITEILSFMEHQKESGENLFQNPASLQKALFPSQAIATLKEHPVTKTFIEQYEKEKARLMRRIEKLSAHDCDAFYAHLETYLRTLCEIGKRTQPWSFPEEDKVVAWDCLEAKFKFMKSVEEDCDEARKLFFQTNITTKLQGGSKETVKFSVIFWGNDGWDSMITQQIYLWSFLRKERPSTVIPTEVVNSFQGRMYELAPATVAGGVRLLSGLFSLSPASSRASPSLGLLPLLMMAYGDEEENGAAPSGSRLNPLERLLPFLILLGLSSSREEDDSDDDSHSTQFTRRR